MAVSAENIGAPGVNRNKSTGVTERPSGDPVWALVCGGDFFGSSGGEVRKNAAILSSHLVGLVAMMREFTAQKKMEKNGCTLLTVQAIECSIKT